MILKVIIQYTADTSDICEDILTPRRTHRHQGSLQNWGRMVELILVSYSPICNMSHFYCQFCTDQVITDVSLDLVSISLIIRIVRLPGWSQHSHCSIYVKNTQIAISHIKQLEVRFPKLTYNFTQKSCIDLLTWKPKLRASLPR